MVYSGLRSLKNLDAPRNRQFYHFIEFEVGREFRGFPGTERASFNLQIADRRKRGRITDGGTPGIRRGLIFWIQRLARRWFCLRLQSRRDRHHGYEGGTGESRAPEPLAEPNLTYCGQPISRQMCVQNVRTAAINFVGRQLIVSDGRTHRLA